MCAQGIKWNTTKPLQIGANKDADTLIAGYDNGTVLGEKTETVVGGRGEGVGGLKTEIIAGAQIGAVGGLKYDTNYGMRYDYSYGYKYGRSPIGTVEDVGDCWDKKKSHTSTVGTNFFVAAGGDATIHAGTIAFSGTTQVQFTSCANSALPVAALSMTPTTAALTIASPALDPPAGLNLTADSAALSHPTLVSLGCGTGGVVNIRLAATMMSLNATTTQINGTTVELGMPPIENPDIALALRALQDKLAATAAAQQADMRILIQVLDDVLAPIV